MEEDSSGKSEDDQKDTKDKSAQEEGNVEGKLKYKKPKNKRIRHQQINDSSDSSTMNDDSDNDTMNDQIRKKPVESRKGIG